MLCIVCIFEDRKWRNLYLNTYTINEGLEKTKKFSKYYVTK